MPANRSAPAPEEFLATFPPEIRAFAEELRSLIRQSVPSLIEAVYPGWRLIGYRVVEGKRSAYFGFIAPFEDRVFLGFEYGAFLLDPNNLLEGSGRQVRQVRVERPEDIRPQELSELIKEAARIAALPRDEKRRVLLEMEEMRERKVLG